MSVKLVAVKDLKPGMIVVDKHGYRSRVSEIKKLKNGLHIHLIPGPGFWTDKLEYRVRVSSVPVKKNPPMSKNISKKEMESFVNKHYPVSPNPRRKIARPEFKSFDNFERFAIAEMTKRGVPYEKAVTAHVNSVEGDISQLSPALQRWAYEHKVLMKNPHGRDPYTPGTSVPRYRCRACQTIFEGEKWSRQYDTPCPVCRAKNSFHEITRGGRVKTNPWEGNKIFGVSTLFGYVKKGKMFLYKGIVYTKSVRKKNEAVSGVFDKKSFNADDLVYVENNSSMKRVFNPCRNPGNIPSRGTRSGNPPAGAPLIYPRLEEIRATKTGGPFAGRYKHKFNSPARVYGLPDGSLKIVGKKRLWKKFHYK